MANVLVTGGTGYIAGWCMLALLDAGHSVRTTVRDLAREPQLRESLRRSSTGPSDMPGHGGAESADRLRVFRADLRSDEGWREAVDGCDYVLHVASPTLTQVPRSDDEMVRPAVDGALRVLRAARAAGVRRVVLTSAIGAIAYGHDRRDTPFTERDWTNVDADIAPYQKSKTLAERAAWDYAAGSGLELATVNPTAVLGPVLGPDYSPSLNAIAQMLDGSMPALLPFATGYVDVRDVAALHLLAMTEPAAAGERFIATAGHSLWLREVAAVLRDRLGERAAKVPTREMPLLVARGLAKVNPQMRNLRALIGRNLDASSAKAERLLGWKTRPIEDTIVDTAESLLALPS
ncbi:NAD-dependent epimerase/dehydratase family protein [Paractinoplanes lichenicola]|uniref:NAD-dependent epimerase/dehydratase family protein n=1 Tax=Paractinoplanes lichenicola TaxID=2802976 RepID=A0ABS1W4P5_9ACTN|nr:NAD-dependent epimerase/dehydratase family protein [Actinoplanes lichenicola]MBL7261712.1 NAD-dependent epimerase/dehydratase family protein [Actinoplanes lichenicola]